MNKNEFMKKLSRRLRVVRAEERERTLSFYDEMISDAVEEGLSEEQAIEKLGGIDTIADRAIEQAKESGEIKPATGRLSTTLIALGSPMWLVLLAVSAAVIIALYAAAWSVIVSLFAVVAAFAASALAGAAGLVLFVGRNAELAVCLLGAGMVCAGLCLLCAHPVWLLAKKLAAGTGHACAGMWRACVNGLRRAK